MRELQRDVFAVCYASGEIAILREAPGKGEVCFARGPEDAVRALVAGNARLSCDDRTYLVPGVPEAADQNAGVDALLTWLGRLRSNPANRELLP